MLRSPNSKFKTDEVTYSGYKNFRMLFTAAEMEQRGRLAGLICGGGHALIEQSILNCWNFKKSNKLLRFVNPEEKIPLERIYRCGNIETLSLFAGTLSIFGFDIEKLAIKEFEIHGERAKNAL
ncbi:hypothetical protein ACFOEW_00210 [Alteromonas oceani]|uniref:Uncharacterized protein n=1 Tax=Alteromonas oceani TaxID=2071609 RepID=A0ABV7JVH1_9ALTE|nr:hypothetical protein [Alteromonas oceani]